MLFSMTAFVAATLGAPDPPTSMAHCELAVMVNPFRVTPGAVMVIVPSSTDSGPDLPPTGLTPAWAPSNVIPWRLMVKFSL